MIDGDEESEAGHWGKWCLGPFSWGYDFDDAFSIGFYIDGDGIVFNLTWLKFSIDWTDYWNKDA